jgi:hypothetical protein
MAKRRKQVNNEIDPDEDVFFDGIDELFSDDSISLKEVPTLRLITVKATGKTICFEQTGNVYRMSQLFNTEDEIAWKDTA